VKELAANICAIADSRPERGGLLAQISSVLIQQGDSVDAAVTPLAIFKSYLARRAVANAPPAHGFFLFHLVEVRIVEMASIVHLARLYLRSPLDDFEFSPTVFCWFVPEIVTLLPLESLRRIGATTGDTFLMQRVLVTGPDLDAYVRCHEYGITQDPIANALRRDDRDELQKFLAGWQINSLTFNSTFKIGASLLESIAATTFLGYCARWNTLNYIRYRNRRWLPLGSKVPSAFE
jgi:hypothetical protein